MVLQQDAIPVLHRHDAVARQLLRAERGIRCDPDRSPQKRQHVMDPRNLVDQSPQNRRVDGVCVHDSQRIGVLVDDCVHRHLRRRVVRPIHVLAVKSDDADVLRDQRLVVHAARRDGDVLADAGADVARRSNREPVLEHSQAVLNDQFAFLLHEHGNLRS